MEEKPSQTQASHPPAVEGDSGFGRVLFKLVEST